MWNEIRRKAIRWSYGDLRFGPILRLILGGGPFHKRSDLPFLLNGRGLLGEGVEVGVQRGKFSEQILNDWKGRALYCVDPWMRWESEGYQDVANVLGNKQELLFLETQQRLGRFGERARILRKTSLGAAGDFKDGSLDFVYLDAQHQYEAVRDDLQTWYPKVREGGLIGGHDFCDEVNENGVFGVKRAVEEFTAKKRGRIMLTKGKPISWLFKKIS